MDPTCERHRNVITTAAVPGGPGRPARPLVAGALTGLVAMLALLAPAAPGHAEPGDQAVAVELARTRAILETATERAQQAAGAYTEAVQALPGVQDRLARAQGSVVAAGALARAAGRDEVAAQVTARTATAGYEATAARVDAQRRRVGAFASAAYRGGGMAAISAVFEASDPADAADRLGYLKGIARDQRRALDGFLVARQAARQAQLSAESAWQAAAAARVAADRALADAQAARQAAQRAADQITALIGERDRAVEAARAERSATLARYDQLRRDSAQVTTALAGVAADDRGGSAGGSAFTGSLLTPVGGWKSSDFGMRYDPYYQVWQLHAGVDLAADGGTPIRAAADGRVLRAGWNGGYGNYTCVYHGLYRGRGLATCYGHQSAILVRAGDRVHRGQIIGRVGTTGASTGNHLHFEVRLDGTPVQPLDWLPGCLC